MRQCQNNSEILKQVTDTFQAVTETLRVAKDFFLGGFHKVLSLLQLFYMLPFGEHFSKHGVFCAYINRLYTLNLEQWN